MTDSDYEELVELSGTNSKDFKSRLSNFSKVEQEKFFGWCQRLACTEMEEEKKGKLFYVLAVIYVYGYGTEADKEKSFKCAMISNEAKPSHTISHFIGALYARGTGVEKSKDEALKWYKKSNQLEENYTALKGIADLFLIDGDIASGLNYLMKAYHVTKKQRFRDEIKEQIEEIVNDNNIDLIETVLSMYYDLYKTVAENTELKRSK